jgi:hypothetical protein
LAAAYAFTPVLVAGGNVQQIFNINDRGQTVVNTDLSSGIFHRGTFTRLPPAVIWQQDPLERRGHELVPFLDRVRLADSGDDTRGTNGTAGRGIKRSGWSTSSAPFLPEARSFRIVLNRPRASGRKSRSAPAAQRIEWRSAPRTMVSA